MFRSSTLAKSINGWLGHQLCFHRGRPHSSCKVPGGGGRMPLASQRLRHRAPTGTPATIGHGGNNGGDCVPAARPRQQNPGRNNGAQSEARLRCSPRSVQLPLPALNRRPLTRAEMPLEQDSALDVTDETGKHLSGAHPDGLSRSRRPGPRDRRQRQMARRAKGSRRSLPSPSTSPNRTPHRSQRLDLLCVPKRWGGRRDGVRPAERRHERRRTDCLGCLDLPPLTASAAVGSPRAGAGVAGFVLARVRR